MQWPTGRTGLVVVQLAGVLVVDAPKRVILPDRGQLAHRIVLPTIDKPAYELYCRLGTRAHDPTDPVGGERR
jgi:hypothetical protein